MNVFLSGSSSDALILETMCILYTRKKFSRVGVTFIYTITQLEVGKKQLYVESYQLPIFKIFERHLLH